MLLLAIDSSQRQGSLSLAQDERILATARIEAGTFSAQFIPQLTRLLSETKVSKEQIEAFACASGPGSFTGLRVGLAAIKALAEVLGRPIAAVSVLECIARAAGEQHEFVIAALNAGRGEIYLGEYQRNRRWRAKREFVATNEEFVAFIRGFDAPPPVLIPNDVNAENLASAARAAGALDVQIVHAVNSETVALVALEKLAAGETVGVDALDANYVRRDQTLYK